MQKLLIGLIIMLSILALYSFAGPSDQLDSLTVKQQQEVVARWQQ